MRRIIFFIMALTIACLVSMHAVIPAALAFSEPGEQQAASASASSTELKAGLGIEKLEVTGASDSFKIAPDTRIYAWARVKGIDAGTNVSLIFSKGEKEVYRKEVAIPSVPYRINAYRTFRAGDSGDWKVIVAGADGKELASTTIKVEIAK